MCRKTSKNPQAETPSSVFTPLPKFAARGSSAFACFSEARSFGQLFGTLSRGKYHETRPAKTLLRKHASLLNVQFHEEVVNPPVAHGMLLFDLRFSKARSDMRQPEPENRAKPLVPQVHVASASS